MIKCKDVDTAIQKTNIDLINMYKWLNMNKLKLNTEKTKWMLINRKGPNHTCDRIQIGKEKIEKVKQIKYLGVIIDDKLTFNQQIEATIKKVASKTNFMSRIKKKLTFETKKIIYNSIILPSLDFCSTIYMSYTQAHINNLQKLQNRALRLILNCEYGTRTKFMLNELNMMSVKQRWIFNVLVFVYKMKNNLTPKYLSKKIRMIETQE